MAIKFYENNIFLSQFNELRVIIVRHRSIQTNCNCILQDRHPNIGIMLLIIPNIDSFSTVTAKRFRTTVFKILRQNLSLQNIEELDLLLAVGRYGSTNGSIRNRVQLGRNRFRRATSSIGAVGSVP